MKSRWSFYYNILVFFTMLMLLCGIQTTFWLQIFGDIPAPLLWLNLMIFIMLYKRFSHALFLIYALGFSLMAFSLAPLKLIWISLLLLFGVVYFIKKRIFWTGAGYYTIMCAFSGVAFHIIYLVASRILEKNPAHIEFTSRMLQIILTPFFAPATYWMLTKLTKNMGEELTHETGGLDL